MGDEVTANSDAGPDVCDVGYSRLAVRNTGRVSLLLVAGSALVGVRTFGADGPWLPGVFVLVICLTTAAFWLPLAARAMWRAARGRPLISFGTSGVTLHSAGVCLPWTNVTEIHVVHAVRRGRESARLVFVPVSGDLALRDLRGRARRYARASMRASGGPIALLAATMALPLPEVLEVIRTLTSAPVRHLGQVPSMPAPPAPADGTAGPSGAIRQRIGSVLLVIGAGVAVLAQPVLSIALVSQWVTPYTMRSAECGPGGMCPGYSPWSLTAWIWAGAIVLELAVAAAGHVRARRRGPGGARWSFGRRLQLAAVAGAGLAVAALAQGAFVISLAYDHAASLCDTGPGLAMCASGTDIAATRVFQAWSTRVLTVELAAVLMAGVCVFALRRARRVRRVRRMQGAQGEAQGSPTEPSPVETGTAG